jgi:hypothetical protein
MKKLTKKEYASPFNYNPKEYIKSLVIKDEAYIETVVDLQGNAGKPIYQGTEVIFNS